MNTILPVCTDNLRMSFILPFLPYVPARASGNEGAEAMRMYMSKYFMQFQVLGEVAGFLLLKEPEKRLLVDISTQAKDEGDSGQRPYPSRTCFSIFQEDLITAFLKQVSVGDTIKATGTFAQTNYVPHKTSYIDTTFHLMNYRKIYRNVGSLKVNGRVFEPAPGAQVH